MAPDIDANADLPDQQWQLFLATYENRQQLIIENEALGERRLQMFLTVVSAAGVALGLTFDRFEDQATFAVVAVVAGLLTAIGIATVARVAQRDTATSWLKEDLYRMRSFVASGHSRMSWALPHMNDPEPRFRSRPWYPSRGGLVEQIGVLTATFAGLAAACGVHAQWDQPLASLLTGAVVALGAWVLQIWLVRDIYRKADCLKNGRPAPPTDVSDHFRAGVGIVVINADGKVLLLDRADHPGSWQFPQGGIRPGEQRLGAAFRELSEETGLTAQDVIMRAEFGRWLAYELPPEHRSGKTGIGQVQWWFFFTLQSHAAQPDPVTAPAHEFSGFEWVSFDEAVERAASFRREVYEQLGARFAEL